MAVLINAAHELFAFLGYSGIDMAQKPIQRERAGLDEVCRIFNGLLWHKIHFDDYDCRGIFSFGINSATACLAKICIGVCPIVTDSHVVERVEAGTHHCLSI